MLCTNMNKMIVVGVGLLISLVCSVTCGEPEIFHHLKWITNQTVFPVDLRFPIDQSIINDTQMWDWLRLSDGKLISKLPDYPRNYLVSETSNRATLMVLNYNRNTHEELSSYEAKLTEPATEHATGGEEKIVILNNQEVLGRDATRRDVFTLAYLKNHYVKYEKLPQRIKVSCVADFLVSNANRSIVETVMHLMERYASFKLNTRTSNLNNYKTSFPQSTNNLFIGKKRLTLEEKQMYERQFPNREQQPLIALEPVRGLPQQLVQEDHNRPYQAQPFNAGPPPQAPNGFVQGPPLPPPPPPAQPQYYPPQPVQPFPAQMMSGAPHVMYTPYIQSTLPLTPEEFSQFRSDIENFYDAYVKPVPVRPERRRVYMSRSRNYFAPITDSLVRLKRSSKEKRDLKSALYRPEDEQDEQPDYDHKKFAKIRLSLGPISLFPPYDSQEKVTCELNLINMEFQLSEYLNRVSETIITSDLGISPGPIPKNPVNPPSVTPEPIKPTNQNGLIFFIDKPTEEKQKSAEVVRTQKITSSANAIFTFKQVFISLLVSCLTAILIISNLV